MDLKEAGNVAFRNGQWEDAIDLYTKALHSNPAHSPALANRAACLIQLQSWDAALRDCETALTFADLPRQLHLKLIWRKAVCLRKLGVSQQAWQDCVRQGLQIDPGNEKFNEELSYVFVTKLDCMPTKYTSNAPHAFAPSSLRSNTDLLPSLPLTYNGVMRLVRSNSEETHQFLYDKVSGKDLEAALNRAGVEPETLDYFFAMIASHPDKKSQNVEYLEALKRVPRYEIALIMADAAIHAKAVNTL